MKRRQFLEASLAAGIGTLLAPSSADAWPPSGFIDAHAHIFNARDLPWRAFMTDILLGLADDTVVLPPRIVMPQEVLAGALGLLVATIGRLEDSIPSAVAELDRLSAGQPPHYDTARIDEAYLGALAESLKLLYQQPEQFARFIPPFDNDSARWGGDMPAIDKMQAAAAVRAEVEKQIELAEKNASEDKFAEIAAALFVLDSKLGAMIQFGRRLVAPREENRDLFIKTFVPDGKPALFTPALVDFDIWLGPSEDHRIDQQVIAMDALQRQSPVPMHMLVPFNPWAQARWDKLHPGDMAGSPLEIVIQAVMERGAIGVKLYPPMGFLPFDNASAGLDYQPWHATEFPDGDFGVRLDEALLALYIFCNTAEVPILAHASSGNGAREGFGVRAHPSKWLPVLRHPSLPGLKLCLAHFGSFGTQPPAPPKAWEPDSIALIHEFSERVFVDTAYLPLVLPGAAGSHEADVAHRALTDVFVHFEELGRQLVYGSDWHMLAQEPGNQTYPTAIETFLGDAGMGSVVGDVFLGNARRLLGLKEGAQAFERLRRYYGDGSPGFEKIRTLASI